MIACVKFLYASGGTQGEILCEVYPKLLREVYRELLRFAQSGSNGANRLRTVRSGGANGPGSTPALRMTV